MRHENQNRYDFTKLLNHTLYHASLRSLRNDHYSKLTRRVNGGEPIVIPLGHPVSHD